MCLGHWPVDKKKMAKGDIQTLEVQIPHEIIQYGGWFPAFGIRVLVLGIAAVVRSVASSSVGCWCWRPVLKSPKPSWWALGRLLSTLFDGD